MHRDLAASRASCLSCIETLRPSQHSSAVCLCAHRSRLTRHKRPSIGRDTNVLTFYWTRHKRPSIGLLDETQPSFYWTGKPLRPHLGRPCPWILPLRRRCDAGAALPIQVLLRSLDGDICVLNTAARRGPHANNRSSIQLQDEAHMLTIDHPIVRM